MNNWTLWLPMQDLIIYSSNPEEVRLPHETTQQQSWPPKEICMLPVRYLRSFFNQDGNST